MRLIVALFVLFGVSSAFAEKKDPYPGTEKPSCLARGQERERSPSWEKGLAAASRALNKDVFEEGSVWDLSFLEKRPKLKKALEEFLEKKRGMSVKDLDLTGLSPEKIHEILINKGFLHMREPLTAGLSKGKVRYWRRDGSYGFDRQEKGLVPHDIYVHPDGGLVRVKPEGVPNPKYPQAAPAYSKSVLLNLEQKHHHQLAKKVPKTTYRNQAFKVGLKGQPLPKGPNRQFGLRMLYSKEILKENEERQQEQRGWVDAIMQAGHLPIPSDFSHCKNE